MAVNDQALRRPHQRAVRNQTGNRRSRVRGVQVELDTIGQLANAKGELDLTTYEALAKGGKHGTAFKAGQPTNSVIIDEISGTEPSMPKEGDPLTKAEVALFERWIVEGARDDTPTNANSFKLAAPPTYERPPVISALAFSRPTTPRNRVKPLPPMS